jgi:hypothetical protein
MSQFTISKHGRSRFWAVHDPAGVMVCVCVYKQGAIEVVQRLMAKRPHEGGYLQVVPSVERPENGRKPVRDLLKATSTGK